MRRRRDGLRLGGLVRLIHPAPALAVITVSAALATILAIQAHAALDARLALIVVSVTGSQVATGALNDWRDRHRDALVRSDKPIAAGEVDPRAALVLGGAGLAVQLAASALLGWLPLALGGAASVSAQAYNLVLSRTPLSFVPYLVSFGLLPAWIASGIGVPLERVVSASLLVVPFAVSAHLANCLLDWEADVAEGSHNLAQVLGRPRSRLVAAGLALAVGIGVAAAFALSERLQPLNALLGAAGVVAAAQGARSERRLWYGLLAAAVLWTVAWAIST
ncbi:MAG: UbiA family prenyltransferase [Candidatus Limnocylindria bacterium]